MRPTLPVLFLVIAHAGCSSAPGGSATAPGDSATGRYQPLTVGARWIYSATIDGSAVKLTRSIDSTGKLDGAHAGASALPLRSQAEGSDQYTVFWLQEEATGVKELRRAVLSGTDSAPLASWDYLPNAWWSDEQDRQVGEMWTKAYDVLDASGVMSHVDAQYTLQSLDDVLRVEAGQFTCARILEVDHITDANSVQSDDRSTIWYARGVGEVKWEAMGATDQARELVSYSLPSPDHPDPQ
jgi:hypothetical protein